MNFPIFIIVLGSVIFIIAFLGCCVAAFLFQGSLKAAVIKNMEAGMENYNSTGYDGVTMTWDVVQSELKCCGVQTWQDWKNVTQFNDGSVPDSCCIELSIGCGRPQVNIEERPA